MDNNHVSVSIEQYQYLVKCEAFLNAIVNVVAVDGEYCSVGIKSVVAAAKYTLGHETETISS